MEIGASFSHPHLRSLNLEPTQAIKELKKLGFVWVRLGCYWDEIEKEAGKYSFKELDPLVGYCEQEKIKIVMTIGMKAPRYPEYYIPKWLEPKLQLGRLVKIDSNRTNLLATTLKYIEKCVNHFKNSSAIRVWQVENEPLDQSGVQWWRISPEFLDKEVSLVKNLDPKRKIMVNLWGNELSRRKLYKQALPLADIVGLDIYLRHPIFLFFNFFNKYIGPLDSQEKIKRVGEEIKSAGKEFWLAELQAEPWEVGELTTAKDNPPSFLPEQFSKNLQYGIDLNPDVLLLWGFEYWYFRKNKGDLCYWKEAKKLLVKT